MTYTENDKKQLEKEAAKRNRLREAAAAAINEDSESKDTNQGHKAPESPQNSPKPAQ